jgi:hypothetical protein
VQGPLGNSAFVDLVVGPQKVQPLAVLVKQADFAHELMTCVVSTGALPYNGREEGLPVRLTWGHFPGTAQTYYGYVHHTEPYYDTKNNNTVKLVCLGASSSLSQPLQQSWANQSADAVVRDVVTSAYLSVDIEPHLKVWPVLTATDCTAWEFINKLAGKIGYRLRPLATEIRFCSPFTLFKTYYPMAPTLNMGGELARFRLASDVGSLTAQRKVFGLGQRDGRLFSVDDVGADPTMRLGTELPGAEAVSASTVLVDSPGDGAGQLAGTASAERFTYAARATATGDSFLAPGVLVYLLGLEATQNGHWYVQAAEHDLDLRTGDYTTHLDLRRDALGALGAAPQPRIVRPALRQTPSGEVVGVFPPAVLVNGQWRSSWARRAS